MKNGGYHVADEDGDRASAVLCFKSVIVETAFRDEDDCGCPVMLEPWEAVKFALAVIVFAVRAACRRRGCR